MNVSTGTACEVCQKKFARKSTLFRHLRNVHKQEVASNTHLKCFNCSTPISFKTMKDLRLHLSSCHGINMQEHNIAFPNMNDFFVWKKELEQNTKSSYIRHSSLYQTADGKVHSFYCHRSGRFISKGKGHRPLQSRDSCKIGAHCTAYIKAIEKKNSVRVNYGPQHYGHEEMHHMQLREAEHSIITSKIEAGVNMRKILDYVRNNPNKGQLKKIHMMARGDLRSIKRDFQLNKPSEDTLLSAEDIIHFWIESKSEDLNRNPVLCFKQQDVEDPQSSLSAEDFVLAIMTRVQKEFLIQFGKSVVCIDYRHGNTNTDIYLTTLLVIDEFGTCIPSAHLISNRINTTVLEYFFSSIEAVCGKIETEILMTDDIPEFVVAWQNVMGKINTWLLSEWLVDLSWRKNLDKVHGNSEKKAFVYKSIRMLMEFPDVNKFSEVFKSVVHQLKTDTETLDFGQYFEATYGGKRTEMWADCFRSRAIINTNNSMESMYHTLKYVYLEGKRNNRIDRLLDVLLNFLHEKMLARVIKKHDQLTSANFEEISKRHDEGKKILRTDVIPKSDDTWIIRNLRKTSIHKVVCREKECCSNDCKIKCFMCNICIHTHSCSCRDNLLRGNICKHMHAIIINDPEVMHTYASELEQLTDNLNMFEGTKEVRSSSETMNIALQKLEILRMNMMKNEDEMLWNIASEHVIRKIDGLISMFTTDEVNQIPTDIPKRPVTKRSHTQPEAYNTSSKKAKVANCNDNTQEAIELIINDGTNYEIIYFDHSYSTE